MRACARRTASVACGHVEGEDLSAGVIIMIIVSLGLPLATLVVGGVVLVHKRRKARNTGYASIN